MSTATAVCQNAQIWMIRPSRRADRDGKTGMSLRRIQHTLMGLPVAASEEIRRICAFWIRRAKPGYHLYRIGISPSSGTP